MVATLDMIQKGTGKLKAVLLPVIARDYPDLSQDSIDTAFAFFSASVEQWFSLMTKYVVPYRDLLPPSFTPNELVELPQIVPGLTLKPVDFETANKVKSILEFFLSLYDWLHNGTKRQC
jgi:hypothetical protein